MMPTVRNSRVASGTSSVVTPICWMRPMRNEPTTFTISVPYGNSAPSQRAARPEVRYRRPVPIAPPRQINRRRSTDAIISRDLDGLVDVDRVGARPTALGVLRVHVHDGGPAADLAGEDRDADEARRLVLRRDGEHGLPPTLEPGATGRHAPRRRVTDGDVERPREQTADAASPVAVRQRDPAGREVDAVGAHQVLGARVEADRVLEED